MFNLLWLEDRPEAVRYEYDELSKLVNCCIETVEWPGEMLSRLESGKKYDLLLLDIMIPGVKTLVKDEVELKTYNGLATGLVFYEHFIKDKYKIEVIFFTAREITNDLRSQVTGQYKCKIWAKAEFKTTLLPYLQNLIQKK